jgi:two-component system, chemotaxis family, response regulator Rcp1
MEPATLKRTRPARVLLVEDNAGDAQLMRIAFAETHPGTLLDVVTDGETALSRLEVDDAPGERPDLVLLDLNLPRLTGHEVLAAVRESDAAHARRTPVVVLTTSRALGDVQRSYELGARSHITKPLEIDDLFTAVASLATYWFDTVQLPTGED